MNSLFPLRYMVGAFATSILLLFAFGFWHINDGSKGCLGSKHWYADKWLVGFSIGRLEFRYRNWDYHCSPEESYNKKGTIPLNKYNPTDPYIPSPTQP